jgi:hypothetical protein
MKHFGAIVVRPSKSFRFEDLMTSIRLSKIRQNDLVSAVQSGWID